MKTLPLFRRIVTEQALGRNGTARKPAIVLHHVQDATMECHLAAFPKLVGNAGWVCRHLQGLPAVHQAEDEKKWQARKN